MFSETQPQKLLCISLVVLLHRRVDGASRVGLEAALLRTKSCNEKIYPQFQVFVLRWKTILGMTPVGKHNWKTVESQTR